MEDVEDLQAMGTLIEARMQEWEQEWKREGLLKGLREGEARLLERLLRQRFGHLPDWVQLRLQEAPPEQLETWAERLLDVESVEGLFENENE